jgi:hypothetical protein
MKRVLLSAAVVATLALAGCGAASSGGNDPARASQSTAKVEPTKLDLAHIEQQIKPELKRQLSAAGGLPVTIDTLDCIEKDSSTAKCIAKVHDSATPSLTLSINADVDQSTGDTIWTVEQ